jgi:flavin-dependent dehydrogenase
MKARASRFGRDGATLAAPAARYSRVARFRFKLFAVRCDLLIVGAGPAGCAAAVAARRAAPRLQVWVVDAARFPREKPCGGAITGGGLRELELAGLALRVPHAVATHVVLRAAGRAERVALPHPAVVVRRREFDADLVVQAREAGATVLEEARLDGIEGEVAITGRGNVRFGAMIAADGVSGASRRALGLGAGRRVPLRVARLSTARQWDLVFDLDVGFPGYAWRFPCIDSGQAAESCGVYSTGGARELDDALARFARREGVLVGPLERSAIRLFDPKGPVGSGKVLLAGEALGVDPLAGEGIRYALWSGRLAGRLAAVALRRGRAPSPRAYRVRLLGSRSGLVLELAARLAPRLYGPDPRWRRAAADRQVAQAFAALVSGEGPAWPLLALLRRYPASHR